MKVLKKITQSSKIFSFLIDNPNSRPMEIANKLKIPAPSVRRALTALRKNKIVTKPNKYGSGKFGQVKVRRTKAAKKFSKDVIEAHQSFEIKYWIKILKTGNSNESNRTDLVASTWEFKKGIGDSRRTELKLKLEREYGITNLKGRDLNYSRYFMINEPTQIPQFPDIEVHKE